MKKCVSLFLALMFIMTSAIAFAQESETINLVMLTQSVSVEKYVNYFNEHNDKNIHVDYQYVSGGWQALSQKLVTLIAADMSPDITFMSPTYLAEYVARGQLLDLSDYVARDIDKSLFVDGLWESMSANGHVYGAPKDIRTSVMWYNKRIFNELGMAYPCQDWDNPWSVEEWIETMKTVSGKTLDETQTTRGMSPDWRYCRMMNLFQWAGLDTCLDAEGNANYNDPAIVKAYQQIQDGVINGYIATAGDTDAIGSETRFFNGYDAFTLTGTWSYANFVESGNLGCCVVPGGVSNFWNDMYCGFSSTKNPDAVWEVMKFFLSDAYWDWAMSDQIANGIAFSPLKAVNAKYKDTMYTALDTADRDCLFAYMDHAISYTSTPCYTQLENMLAEKTSLFYSLESTDVQGELDEMNERFQEALDEFYDEYGR